MKRICGIVALVGVLGLTVAQAQIRYLTVRAPRNPVPPMGLVPPTPPTPIPSASTSPPPHLTPAPALQGPDFDKAEVQKRIVAFQKQRAREGSDSAQFQLAMRYLKGEGVEKDSARARQWLALSAGQGNAEARRKLAELDAGSK